MHKVTVLYGQPTDPDSFESYYFDTHLSIAATIPSVQRVETAQVAPSPDGTPPPYYRVAELWFADLDTLQASMDSPEGHRTVADLANFATGGVSVLVSSID